MKQYKGHNIESVWYVTKDGTPMGYIWIVDSKLAFRSGKDARAYINGERPRWGVVKVTDLK